MSADQSPMTAGARRGGPQGWAFALFILFGAAQFIAGLVFFFAYNWRDLPDVAKIALPQAIMVLCFIVWAVMSLGSRFGAVAGLVATMMIGVSMAVTGQVYQLGADPWRLFAIWAALALPVALITRSDAQFALALVVASAGYTLFANEVMWGHLPEDWRASLIFGAYAVLAACVLIGRDSIGAGAPPWLRWLLAAASLGAGLIGGAGDLFNGEHMFDKGFAASLALFAIAAALFFARRHDGPVRAMALFALAAWIAALGIRTIFSGEPNSTAEVAFALFLAALFVVADTAALAAALKHFNKPDLSKKGNAS